MSQRQVVVTSAAFVDYDRDADLERFCHGAGCGQRPLSLARATAVSAQALEILPPKLA